jgi:YihY family inner membrane protein
LLLKAAAIVCSVGIYFLIYWLLPNGRVPVRAVLPAAIIMALLTEGAKNLYVRSLPWLNFQEVYGPFAVSVTLMFWAYISGMLLLVGAYLSAAKYSDRMMAKRQQPAA